MNIKSLGLNHVGSGLDGLVLEAHAFPVYVIINIGEVQDKTKFGTPHDDVKGTNHSRFR